MDNARTVERFLALYRTLDASNLEALQEVYRKDIHFVDPAHDIKGLNDLTSYFDHLYTAVEHVAFEFNPPLVVNNRASVRWEMRFSHRRLAQGNVLTIHGMSYIEFDDAEKVYFHRDYFDLGAMLYEHIPLLGRLVLNIKKRLGT